MMGEPDKGSWHGVSRDWEVISKKTSIANFITNP